jgi:rod shape-determining protein MreB
VHVVPDPLECVVKGAGTVLDDVDRYRQVLIKKIED